jgi:hypothetical protein
MVVVHVRKPADWNALLTMSRVPCVGEFVQSVDGQDFRVVEVRHFSNVPDDETQATIEVELPDEE